MTAPRLIYVANNRLPTEKAHGLQIVQMAEALAEAGYAVTLVAPRRRNPPELSAVRSLWAHYGVKQNFAFRRLPCLDLLVWFPTAPAAFLTQTLTFLLALLVWLLPQRPAAIYTRDLFIGVALAALPGRKVVVYEAHQVHHSGLGRALQGFLARHARTVALTAHLAERLRALGATRITVEHDGFRADRFADLPPRETARAALGLPPDALIAGYVGRLETMGMGKGLDVLVEAVARLGSEIPLHLLLVGGPDAGVQAVRAQWAALGLPAERLHTIGQVPPDAVPRALAALDIAVLPLPWTEHFAYYASALKLFEYMAAGCAVVASDLPSTAEVIRAGENGLLFAPGDAGSLAGALRALADPDLRARLSAQAWADAQRYAWDVRARRIRAFVEEG